MAQQSIAQHISALRGIFKLNNADIRLSDRHMYSLMYSVRAMLIKETRQWVMSAPGIFQTIPNIELTEVDSVEACGIDTDCTIKRSLNPLPNILEDFRGPLINIITSLDESIQVHYTTHREYLNKKAKTSFKYNKRKYFWIRNNYLYFPNVEWDMVSINAYFETDYHSECEDADPCLNFQDNLFRLPENLVEKMYRLIMDKLNINVQLQEDHNINKNSNQK